MDAMKLLGSLMGNKSLASGLGGKLLGGLLGGGGQPAPQQQQSGGGLAGLLGGVLGGGGSQGGGGGIGNIIGGLLGGGGAQQQAAAAAPAAAPAPQASENDQAVLMIRAMVNAAKSDGRIDQTEQENIISKLGNDVSQSEINFLKQEFEAPLDAASFARSIPNGLEQQIYAISLTSIDLDTQNEAQYLGNLAQGLKLDPQVCNQIHDQLGAPKIFQ